MSGRIAHRQRYRNSQPRHFVQPRLPFHHDFFRRRWTYRRQDVLYEKRPLGYSLSLIPLTYRLGHQLAAHRY